MLNELPLYRDTFELVSLVTDYIDEFPKKYKYTIGDKLLNTCLNLFDCLVKANVYHKDSKQHQKYMKMYINTYMMVRTLTRLCIEKKIITLKQTSRLALIFEPMVRITDLKNKYIPIEKTENGIYIVRWDYVETEEESGDPIIATWTFEKFSSLPSIEYIKSMINNYYNDIINEQILSGFEWNGHKVWLSIENQTNYKNALDLAVQTSGDSLPVIFRFGSLENPEYYEFKTVDELKEFWIACNNYIQKCVNDGWKIKDSIDWSQYEINTTEA